MGVSTDGILVFGIAFEDEGYPECLEFLEAYDDFDDFVDEELKIPRYPDPARPGYPELQSWRSMYPVDLVRHCSYDYPMYILAVPGTEITARRGYQHIFENGFPEVSKTQISAFKTWCEARGIAGEPRWILCSMWG